MSTPAPPRLPAGERLRRAGVAAWSIIGILIVVAIGLWLLYEIRVIFPPLVLALLIIYLLNPLVTRLEERGVRRSVGAVLAYVVVLGGLTVLVVLIAPGISAQVSNFSESVPELRTDLVDTINDFAVDLDDRFGLEIDTEQISCLLGPEGTSVEGEFSTAECDRVTREFRESISHHAGQITEIGFSVLEGLLVFILAPLLALYILIDLPHLQRDALNLVPETHRGEFADLGSKIGRAVGGFFRGQLLVALLVGVMSSIGFWIIGLPFWLVIGAIAGFTNLIPLVGPFIGGGLGLIVGTITEGSGLGLLAALVALIVQQIDNHVISPNVMKRTVQIHPATVMLSLLAGGTIAGFWGVLLGVPAVAVVKLLLAHFWTTRVLGEDVSPHARVGGTQEPPSVVPEETEPGPS
ncbi:MAG TPA: AI-2E family transporter [Actinomycetota bacterium]|nr:AI-2E family transporter [Actinomycetota bacterium]